MDEESQRPRGLLARMFGRRPPPPPVAPPPIEPLEPEPMPPAEAEWLEAAISEFESRLAEIMRRAGDDLYAQIERDLARTEELLRETEQRLELNVAERLDGAVAELRVQGDAQLADELERFKEATEAPLATIRKVRSEAVQAAESAASRADESATKAAKQIEATSEKLGVRVRRQELKLAREENSKRIKGALERLERQADERMSEVEAVKAETEELLAQVDERVSVAGDAVDELDRRLEATGQRLAAAESRAEATASLVEDAVQRLDDAVASVEDAERRVLEILDRVAGTAQRIAELGENAEQAVDWEGRIAAATRTEADAAQRISDAERRLLERIDPGEQRN